MSKFKTIFSIVRGWKNALVLDFVGNDNIGWYKGCLWATPSPGVGERSTSIYDCPFEDDQKAKVAEFTARYRQLTRAPRLAPPSGQFHRNEFDFIAVLGFSGHTTILQCIDKRDKNGVSYALRRVKKEQNHGKAAMREKHILLAVDYPFILTLYETFYDNAYIYFMMELSPCGTLLAYTNCKHVGEDLTVFWIAQLVLVVEYLHAANIIHRDIRLGNMWIQCNGYIKLANFSAAKCLDECANGRTRTFRGTLYYMAPEIMCRKYYGKEVDWWTVGITTHALLYGKSPLQVMHSRYNEEKLRQTIGDGFSQDYFKDVSDAAKDFMYWTLRVDPMFRLGVQRPGQSPMKRHVFFVGIDFKALYLQRILFPRFPYMPVPLEFIEPSRDELRFQTPAININDDEYDCF